MPTPKSKPPASSQIDRGKMEVKAIDAEKIRSQFLQVLHSRRSAQVPLTVEPGKPVVEPMYQENPKPLFSEEMESCPKANISNFKELLKEENFYLITEEGEQGKLPVLILSMKESNHQRRPAVVFLHSTNKCKEWLRPLLEAYASRGYIAVAVDSRYHGERASSLTTYQDALVLSWKKGDTMPFIFDTVWDLIKLADYLTQREDIDPSRIGITGESLGGMHAWFAAAADTRYSVVVPIIGVQGFRWAIDNDKWQARVNSIKAIFEEAQIELNKSEIDKEVVEKVWDKIAPGLASKFDAPYTVPIIAPRPLLILTVPLTVKPRKPVLDPLYQDSTNPLAREAMESCPRENISDFKELLVEENFYLITEEGEQGRLPVLILSMKESNSQRRPAVVFLHCTDNCKEWLRPLLEAYASRGYIAISIDSRYHGERASSLTTYRDALVSSWKKGDAMPFIFDTVWDLIKLADYLTQREDIDPSKIGITGVSLGGMHAWFAAAADTRYTVVVPIIGIQGFRWAIDNDQWQARVNSITAVFEEAQTELNKSAIDKEVVEKVWDRIAPGLASKFDAPYTLPIIAPRPLLVLNGEKDPRCPIAGLEIPMQRVHKAYEDAHCPNNFKFIAEPGIGHQLTSLMVKEASDWFDKFLK